MSERTDERTSGSGSDDVDLDELLDDDLGSTGGSASGDVGSGGDAGFSDDELGVDVDALTREPDATSTSSSGASAAAGGSSSSSSLLGRLVPSVGVPNPLEALPSGRSVLLSFGVVIVSMLLFTSVPLLGALPMMWIPGIFAGAFALGLVSGESRYFELALAGAVIAAASVSQGFFAIAMVSNVGLAPFLAIGGGLGLVASVLGHYFGRDFRDGLTRDI